MVTLADLVPKSRVISYSTDAGRLSLEQVLLTNFIVIKTNERERERIVDTSQAGYIVNLSDFYSYRLIGKLTAFLQLQEFSLRNQIVDFSTSDARRSLLS